MAGPKRFEKTGEERSKTEHLQQHTDPAKPVGWSGTIAPDHEGKRKQQRQADEPKPMRVG